MNDGYFEYQAFSASEWRALEARHHARGGDAIVRADSSSPRDIAMDSAGLFVRTTFDQSNRPIHEFSLPENESKRSTWMAPYMSPPLLQVAMTNNVETTRRQFQRYLAEHPEAQT